MVEPSTLAREIVREVTESNVLIIPLPRGTILGVKEELKKLGKGDKILELVIYLASGPKRITDIGKDCAVSISGFYKIKDKLRMKLGFDAFVQEEKGERWLLNKELFPALNELFSR